MIFQITRWKVHQGTGMKFTGLSYGTVLSKYGEKHKAKKNLEGQGKMIWPGNLTHK